MSEKMTKDLPPVPGSSPINGAEKARELWRKELKQRVERGEYWVDLDLLACLLVDSEAVEVPPANG